jgi:AcrR family transcriptional regulator
VTDAATETKSGRKPRRPPVRFRELRKLEREERIVAVAADLFAARGYLNTSIEMIAEKAGLAVGTVYNYFGSKGALLQRVVIEGRPAALQSAKAVIMKPPADPAEALTALVMAQIRGAMRHDKRLWRVVQATSAAEPESFGLDYREKTISELGDQIGELLIVLRDRGDFAAEINVAEASRLIKYVESEIFRRYVADEISSLGDVETGLRPKLTIIARGLRA